MALKLEDCLLYAVTDPAWLGGQTLADQVEAALRGGATMVQLREKALAGEALEREAREILALCRRHGVPLLINDDVFLAKKIGADGVHVGQDDMAAEKAREILGPDAILGVTARTVAQARAAQAAGADYIGSGAVFGTSTKKDARAMDLSCFRQICGSVSIPVVAIGGIALDNIRKLAGCGMAGFAIVSGIFAAPDIETQTRRLWEEALALCLPETVRRIRKKVEERRPIVQCITNVVTVNDCANALLAAGASPTMAHHVAEMEDFARATDALVCNMGATESLEAMSAAVLAGKGGRPIVIDPVGCAASSFRREQCRNLLEKAVPTMDGKIGGQQDPGAAGGPYPVCIRGNAAEIRALATGRDTGRGVDAPGRPGSGGSTENLTMMENADKEGTAMSAMGLARMARAVVVASGAVDFVTDGNRAYRVFGGTPWMARVTGTGCMLSALMGAFLAVEPSALGAAACCALMKACGETAAARTAGEGGGAGTFHIRLLDALSGEVD